MSGENPYASPDPGAPPPRQRLRELARRRPVNGALLGLAVALAGGLVTIAVGEVLSAHLVICREGPIEGIPCVVCAGWSGTPAVSCDWSHQAR